MEQYISKNAIIAEIEKRIKEIDEIGTYLSPKGVLTNLLCRLDTIEVKEVEEPNKNLEEAASQYSFNIPSAIFNDLTPVFQNIWKREIESAFVAGAEWGKNQAKVEIQAQSIAVAHGCPKEPVSKDLEKSSERAAAEAFFVSPQWIAAEKELFKAGANWQKEHLWKPADGDDLPEIDREVIALLSNGKVVYAHRPQEYWDGKNIATEEVTRYYPARYDKGGWNISDIKFWLDCELPIKEE